MPTQVLMPQLGESVVEGTITKWLKATGDRVVEFEPLLEVNTDKIDTEIPSPVSGLLLEILVEEGTTVQAGTLLARIGAADESSVAASPIPGMAPVKAAQVETATPSTEVAPPTRAGGRGVGFISPVVAKIAGEQGVDLFQVKGTGEGGRITKKDVLAYIEKRQAAAPAASPGEATPLASTPAPLPSTTPGPKALPGEILPFTPVRRTIAEHMVSSKHTAAHVTTVMEADLSRVVAHRQANKDIFARDGVNLTYTAYFVSAAVTALKADPLVNSSWTETGILLHRDIHIGIATSLGEAGLIVPVIKNADSLSLLGLARLINDLANRARARQLKPDEVKGGTFTITNHGVSGSLFATPIINQPQCAILGVGMIQKRVVVVNDAIAIRPMAYLSLTFDHRILDGAIADHFLGKVIETLQSW
jgi:2-oxoglutarate dehydrogenase dihydrolipoamide succinyltransferase (E2 component)